MKNILNKKRTWIFVIIGSTLLVTQFIRPKLDNPPIVSDIIIPDSIKTILHKACYDCHSNETKLAWFDKITPANWLVSDDILKGRKVVNFSEWDNISKERQKGILFESLNHIQFGIMPLKQYTFLHPKAKIGTNEINSLQSYLNTLLVTLVTDTMKTNAWNNQFAKWKSATYASGSVKPSPNGIAFIQGYKDWVAISATVRMDDGRIRVITGNKIAVDAIKTNQTNPWPDGTVFAKIAWIMAEDSSGTTHAGEFKQVAFMIKDNVKYRSTEGWGFAQWENGIELTPHGKNVMYTTGCLNCHKPMKDFDFVFTMPLQLSNEPVFEDKVICSFFNKTEGTISILYGNDIAAIYARMHAGKSYPSGSKLTLVKWRQQGDTHWFGAFIPGAIQSIEKIQFKNTGDTKSSPEYEIYEGSKLIKKEVSELRDVRERLNYILNLHASVMP